MNIGTRFHNGIEVCAVSSKLTRERWQEILRCREDFVSNRVNDPTRTGIDREVAESWVRSREMGVSPTAVATATDRNRFTELSVKRQLLIHAVSSLLDPIHAAMVSQGHIFYLIDGSGIILLNKGMWTESEALARESRSGVLSDERTEGTTAHSLCFRLKRPVQLLGPEHYCSAFQFRHASAAPIMDENDEPLAALVILSPPLLDLVGAEDQSMVDFNSLRLVSALAVAAEMQLRQYEGARGDSGPQIERLRSDLRRAEEKLATVQDILTASLAFCDAGLVVVDCRGNTLQVNQEAHRILHTGPGEVGNHNINRLLSDGSALMEKAIHGESFITDASIKNFGKARNYRLYAHPILGQHSKSLDAMVLKFVSAEKCVEQNHGGANASFTFPDILGQSREMKAVVTRAERYANGVENILILGESGTGKELFAQSIHNAYRPKGPFVAVNCAALPQELVGTELFGYEGGSFTGADRQGKAGKVELAHGGTLFLDEIGDMSLEHQAILLRTLEDKRVMRVGGSRYKEVDFRLIAATNRDLSEKVREHTFREDLYYRISVLTLDLPSLRKRAEDVALLSRNFLECWCARQGCSVPVISPEAMRLLEAYSWPGNVRQLRNAIHHAVNTCEGDVILPDDLPRYIFTETPQAAPLTDGIHLGGQAHGTLYLKELEKAAIEAALRRSNGIDAAAESVGLSRSTLYRKIKEYKLVRESAGVGAEDVARKL